MSGASIIIEIPIEVLHSKFRVEVDDPLKPLMDGMKSSKKIKSKLQSVNRLDALSRSSSSISQSRLFPTTVIRDLWKGKYWHLREKNLSLDGDITGSIHRLTPIPKIDLSGSEGEVKDMARPFLGWFAKESGIDVKKISAHVRLEDLKSTEISFLKAKISQKEDRTKRKYWMYEEGPFKQLISEYIDKEPGFEIDEPEVTEEVREWPYAPEVRALQELRMNRTKEKALEILDSIREQVSQDRRPRLDFVKQVVGFRQDMWDAAQEVIRSAKKRVFILTSFSNPQFSDDVAGLLAEVVEESKPTILLSFGEPDRGRSPENIKNTELYISTIAKDKRFKLNGGISPKSSHAKIVISDTGVIFIGSCNLFSGSLQSGVLESGLLIKDNRCAKSILEAVYEGDWIPEKIKSDADELKSSLDLLPQSEFKLVNKIGKKISKCKSNLNGNSGNKGIKLGINRLEQLLQRIAEKPIWSLINTLEHRPFMEDCVERFENRIVMASDGLRSNGMDKATIRRIDQRASISSAQVQVWWGRHAPESKPYDEIDQHQRKEARERLEQLSELSEKGRRKKWWFMPYRNYEPMETHAKLFMVDDLRLMITSDNTLSFGATELERGDAGELGIMVDHPRLTIQTRGSMEIWLPKSAKRPSDLTSWWALLGEEISFHQNSPIERIPLRNALDSLIERIEGNDHLNRAWELEIEANNDENGILINLLRGIAKGLFTITIPGKKRNLYYEDIVKDIDNAKISLEWMNPVWRQHNMEIKD